MSASRTESTRETERRGRLMWHDCECGGYGADLDAWRRLTATATHAVELGAGLGRVALELARPGLRVTAIESDPVLAAALVDRAQASAKGIEVRTCDALECDPPGGVDLVLATMQFVQLMHSRTQAARLLGRWASALGAGGRLAAAIVEGLPPVAPEGGLEALPDVREEDGWVAASTPIGASEIAGRLLVERRRELISPGGERIEERSQSSLMILDADELEQLLVQAGLVPVERIEIAPSAEHVGSTIVVAEAGP